ncbi:MULTISPECIES: quinone oxidoreductase family protein [Salimicrobium]|uniref:Alcohol dehydrogenase n=1 Tax=Salimicrobium humidisoli TaxID=2029857 RepID=A0ABX4HRD9_9BACI|nr:MULTISPECIES: quinone oxidoreductase [Salimicrobium]PBB05141.1 alcohol dehydrogenase [Salimicrobium humidisoli]
MKAIQFKEYGEADVLNEVDVEMPEPGDNEVQIEVKAIGVNFADTARRRGQYVVPTPLPFVPGAEVAGVVSKKGKSVTNVEEGDRIVTLVESGGYSEYVTANASSVVPVPEGVEDEQAVALLLQGLTAYHLISTMGRMEKGETILVHAAAGGVGMIAVQLAKHFQAGKVIATASSEEKLKFAKDLGADAGIDYTKEDWQQDVVDETGGKGVDVALEMAGGDVFTETLKTMRAFGRVLTYGAASGEPPQLNAAGLMGRNLSVIGFFLPQIMKYPELVQKSMKELLTLVQQGELKLHIGGVYKLSEAPQAHKDLENRKTKGKLVLKP